MGDWDSPPTPEEMGPHDPWAAPPTPQEAHAASPHEKMVHAIGGLIPKARYSDGSEETDAEHDAATAPAVDLATGLTMPEIPGVGKAVNWVAEKVGGGLKSAANSLAARTLKGTAGEYKELGKEGVQKMGSFLLDNGAVTPGASPATVGSRVADLPEATGKALGASIDALDQTGAQVSKRALLGQFQALAQEARQAGPGAAPLVAKYEAAAQAVLQDIAQTGQEMMPFAQAEKWKQAYQAPINYAKAQNTPLEMGAKEIASASRQGVEDAAGVASEGTDLGGLNESTPATDFLKAKQESGLAQQAARMAKGAEGRAEARGLVGPVAKGVSWTAAALSALHGNIPGAAAALAAGPVMQSVATRTPATAAWASNQLAEKVSALARANPAKLGKYASVLTAALQSGGQDSLAANLYVIGQTDPEGSDALRKSLESP